MSGDLYRNARALKQIRALVNRGWTVKVWHVTSGADAFPLPEGISVEAVPVASAAGPRGFREIHTAFKTRLATQPARIIHASDLYVLSAASHAATGLDAKLTYDAREYYSHVAGTVGKPWASWWWRLTERRSIQKASAVFTVSESIADALASDHGIERPSVVMNVPDTQFDADLADHPGLRSLIGLDAETPLFVHLGQMKKDRGGSSLVKAMVHAPDAHLAFLGFGGEESNLRALVDELDLSRRVHFVPPVGPDEVRSAIRDATAGVTMLEDTCLNHRYALPNKLFDYLHAGLPVLGSDLVEVRRVIENAGCGAVANARRPGQIGQVMREMSQSPQLSEWQKNALRAAETFTWSSASERFLRPFEASLSSADS